MREVILPWPDSRYYPNKFPKLHWATRGRLAAVARLEGAVEARRTKITAQLNKDGFLPVTIEYTPPKRSGRQPDDDAMIGMLKHHRDGIADVIGIDDNKWRVTPKVLERKGRGQVRVVFDDNKSGE